MRETHVDLQSQGNYTLFRETMALPVQNINHSAFRSMFEKEKLSGNNFNDWFARLKLVLRVEKKMHVIEQPLPPAPEAGAEPNIVAQWTALYDAHTEIACLMLGSMTPELHRQFELHYPYDMIQELRSMFEKQAGVEKFDLIQSFHACKQEEGKSVADYVLKMKGYVEQLERLGYMLPQDISVGLILNGLTKDFVGFVRNYNMHNMGKTIEERYADKLEQRLLQSVKDYLGKCFAMKDLGETAFILGIKIYRDRSKRLIGVSQNAYMDKILKRYKMDNSKRGTIPMQERLDMNKSQGAQTPKEVNCMKNVPYASANPGKLHWTAVKNILKYLRNTKDMFLVYGGNPSTELRVDCYCNTGFKIDIDMESSPDNKVTDHRLKMNFELASFLDGDIETAIQSCVSMEQRELLEELADSVGTASR
ncbi:zinc finger, CCHC-type containing protein [Tanacetum coccineum]